MAPGRRLTAAGLYFLIVLAAASAQVELGLDAMLTLQTYHDARAEAPLRFSPGLRLAPLVSAFGERFQLRAEPVLVHNGHDGEDVQVHLDYLDLELYPRDWLSMRLGRFLYVPGPAEFLRSTAFFSAVNVERLLEGNLDGVRGPADLIQGTVFLGPAFLRGTVAPVPGSVTVPDQNSPWFPGFTSFPVSIPEELSVSVTTGEARWDTADGNPPVGLDGLSTAVEAAIVLGRWDLGLYHFYGWSPAMTLVADGTYNTADSTAVATVRPYRYRTHLAGVSASVVAGSARFWSEAMWESDRAVTRSSLVINPVFFRFRTGVQRGPAGNVVLGGSWHITRFPATIIAETSVGFTEEELSNGTIETPLYRSAVVAVRLLPLDGVLQVDLAGLLSLDGPSVLTLVALEYRGSDNLRFVLRLPLIWGDPDGDLGRFQDVRSVTASVRVLL